MATIADASVPPHVPAELVRPSPFVFGTITEADPFNEWVPEIPAGPPTFYTRNAYPGIGPAWVVRRMAHLREFYMDTATFSSKDLSPCSNRYVYSWTNWTDEIEQPENDKN